MKIEIIDSNTLETLIANPESFIEQLKDSAYIVRGYFDPQFVDYIKNFCLDFSTKQKPSWRPCVDGCPDYHRIHDQYPNAYVKSTQHAYYFHPWNANARLLDNFKPLFDLKARLSFTNPNADAYLANIPSQGPIARLVVHQYPSGGGGKKSI